MIKNFQEVEQFISHFRTKLKFFGIVFIDRAKNAEALEMLGITEKMRLKVIEEIETTDYIETITDELSFGDMWVFGKDAYGEAIYIKISLGRLNSSAVCISFHKAEYPLDYKFKDGKNS